MLQKITAAESTKDQLSPELKTLADEHVPLQRTAAKATSETQNQDLMRGSDQSPDEIMVDLANGVLNPLSAKLALLGLMKHTPTSDRPLLQCYIDNVGTLTAETARPKSNLLNLPGALKSQGKLMNLYKHTTAQVLQQLHKTGKQEHKQNPVVNSQTDSILLSKINSRHLKHLVVY